MSEHTLSTPNVKRLERSQTDKVIAGVSAGLGRYFDLTPAVFRLGFVVLTLLGGAGILVYLAAVLIIPKEGEERSMAEDVLANRREHPARLVALGLIAVAVLSLLARADTWPTAGTAWTLVIVAGLIFLWTRKGRGLVAAALTALAVLAVAIVAAVTIAFAWFNVSLDDGIGKATYTPTSIQATSDRYDLGIGRLTVDLTQLPLTQSVHVRAHVGIGELRIIVPRAAQLVLTSRVKAGDRSVAPGTDGKEGPLYVNAQIGAGHIEVVNAP